MNNYNKNYFWTTVDPIIKEKRVYFKINGTMVEIPEESYRVYFNSYMKIMRDSMRDKEAHLCSLDAVNDDGNSLADIIPTNSNMERDVYFKIMIQKIKREIDKLEDDEKKIIFGILLEDKSIRKNAS